ncbi:imidazole glycerol phosphate synthase subunit HisH [Planktomarina temperata]|nr:imidazole glycerol phosphate synthase subunit HisH [Planktomarina temperata]
MFKILDLGYGNISSLANWCNTSNVPFEIQNRSIFNCDDVIILPGVGSAVHALKTINQDGWRQAITDHHTAGGKIIAICLGYQLLFEYLEEADTEGLGILKGTVRNMGGKGFTGWKDIEIPTTFKRTSWFKSLKHRKKLAGRVYYNHTYKVISEADSSNLTILDYTVMTLDSQIMGLQFHPEKSQKFGQIFINEFAL